MGLYHTKNFCTAREQSTKRRPAEWEKIFVDHIPDKGLISVIYEQLIRLNNKKQKTSNLKMGRRSE